MRLVVVQVALMGVIGLAIVGIQVLDRGGAAVESGVRRYAAAISHADLDAALAEIAPEHRADWSDWVRSQLGNVYVMRGVAVRSASIVERVLGGAQAGPFEVTAIMDVNPDYPDEFYQPTARVDVEQVDGQWYLATPLLAN